ncbi:phospholipase A1-like [Tribolium madens]|uniref:phospholipase A1-like n=1 Tax=Tribolium madens TaxID=41895 RepID=UPI001CF73A26|nr:phospholipase A1-like [Tribolium madens]
MKVSLCLLVALFVGTFGSDSDPEVRATPNDVTYYFYTKHNVDAGHSFQSLGSSLPHFEAKKRTFILIHGWMDGYNADVNKFVKSALLEIHDVNIFVVDWSPIAKNLYSTARKSVTNIGQFVGNFVNDLIDTYGISSSEIVLIGHSLGAHIAGNAGSVIKSPVGQIIGLDPAGPGFSLNETGDRLDSSDGQYVQVIHTHGRLLGFSFSSGHVDYYPNGGNVQAGCGLDLAGVCSHARSFQYLAEAITGGKFLATKCDNYSDYQNGKCANNQKAFMGSLVVDQSVVGDYFLDTNKAKPFAQG